MRIAYTSRILDFLGKHCESITVIKETLQDPCLFAQIILDCTTPVLTHITPVALKSLGKFLSTVRSSSIPNCRKTVPATEIHATDSEETQETPESAQKPLPHVSPPCRILTTFLPGPVQQLICSTTHFS